MVYQQTIIFIVSSKHNLDMFLPFLYCQNFIVLMLLVPKLCCLAITPPFTIMPSFAWSSNSWLKVV